MSSIITNAMRLENLKAMQAAIADTVNNSFYLCFGRPREWDDDAVPPAPIDSEKITREFWDDAMFGKKVATTNTRQGILLRRWQSGQFYDMYRDDYDGTIATKTLAGGVRYPLARDLFDTYFYVINPANLNVYKCLYNRDNTTNEIVASTDNSFLTDTSGNVVSTTDGYLWKYMYTVTAGDAALFNTPNFIPADAVGGVPLVDGGIYAVVVSTAGAYTVAPTVVFTGDGTGAAATAHLAGGGVVWIEMTNPGSGYTHCQVSFTGGTGAGGTVAKAIISPRGGHGIAPADELGGIYLMFQQKFVADESGDAPVAQDFRQLALIKNPTKAAALVTAAKINMCPSLAFDAALTPANLLTPDDAIEGVTSGAKAIVVDYDATNYVCRYVLDWATEPAGFPFQNAEVVTNGVNSGTTLGISGVIDADVDINTGSLIYVENRIPILRDVSQTEDCRIVLEF